MAHGYMGRTTIDIAASVAVVMFLVVLTVGLSAPGHQLKRVNDEMRTDGVRNIMEAILEMQTVDPDSVDRLREEFDNAGAPPRVMLGSAESCAGSWGVQCGDAILADTCLDPTFFGKYLAEVPIDGGSLDYSAAHTGYYLTFGEGVLEVGACNPELQEVIQLDRTFF